MPSQYEDLARAALLEITKPATIGAFIAESKDDDGVITVRFESLQGGYPGWQWNVSLAHVDGYDPTVIESELLPADGALLAPDWVPWSDRLAEYKAAQEAAGLDAEAALAAETGGGDDDSDDDDELDDDDDDDELDEDGSPVLHAGDLDGVDIDDLDEAAGDDDADDDDESDDDAENDSGDDAEAVADEVAAYGAEDTEDL